MTSKRRKVFNVKKRTKEDTLASKKNTKQDINLNMKKL